MVMGLPDRWDTYFRTMIFQDKLAGFAHWGDTIAIGLGHDVVLLDAITGIRTSVLCGHTEVLHSLAFSQDGSFLISGGVDASVRVWDVQTGGVIRTFDRHTSAYFVTSISSDGAMVASGTRDGEVRLCDVRTGESNSIKMHDGIVTAIEFSPINPRHFISSSGRIVGLWDVDGDQIGPSYREANDVEDLAWTRDGTRFVSCGANVATVREAESGAVVVRLDAPDGSWPLNLCCFSPDGRFVACAANATIFVWDITIPGARLVGHLVEHPNSIKFLAFLSSESLISGDFDGSVKFWKSSSFSMDLKTSDQMVDQMAAHDLFQDILSIKLFAEEGMVVTSGEDGVVKIWDVMTGRCKSSFSTPAKGKRDTHLAGDTLIIVWCTNASADADADTDGDTDTDTDADMDRAVKYCIWDVYKGQLLRKFQNSSFRIRRLRISGDGSKIFRVNDGCIVALSMETGEVLGRVEFESGAGNTFFLSDSEVGDDDFGDLGVLDFEELLDGLPLNLVGWQGNRNLEPCWMEEIVTKRQVFRLPEKYLEFGRGIEWDGRYLFNWSRSGEVEIVVIDFDPVCPRLGSYT